MSTENSDAPRDIELVRALMKLRKVKPADLAIHTGVQIENLHAWLQGTASALAHRSYIALLTYLGLTAEGLSKEFVQHWEMDVKRAFSEEQLDTLIQMAPWLSGGSMIEIVGSWQPLYGKTRVFAIRGDNFKVLLAVRGGLRMPAALTPDILPGIVYRTTEDDKEPKIEVEALYWNAVRNKAITPAEFDDLFLETSADFSWNDLRLLARERGITPSMLALDILTRDMQEADVAVALDMATQVETAVETEVEAPERAKTKVKKEVAPTASVAVAPVRTRRRAAADRITVDAPAVQVEVLNAMSVPLSASRREPTKFVQAPETPSAVPESAEIMANENIHNFPKKAARS